MDRSSRQKIIKETQALNNTHTHTPPKLSLLCASTTFILISEAIQKINREIFGKSLRFALHSSEAGNSWTR